MSKQFKPFLACDVDYTKQVERKLANYSMVSPKEE